MPETIIKEYMDIVSSVYGVYLDGCQGFSSSKKVFEQSQLVTIQNNKKLLAEHGSSAATSYCLTIEALDSACLIYSKGSKSESNYRMLHYCETQKEYKSRNSPDGENYKFIGNMALISIYEYWENSCRNKLAVYHQVKQCKIKSTVFGDLRYLRNSIIHHNGVALPDVEKCKKFFWYKKMMKFLLIGIKWKILFQQLKIQS